MCSLKAASGRQRSGHVSLQVIIILDKQICLLTPGSLDASLHFSLQVIMMQHKQNHLLTPGPDAGVRVRFKECAEFAKAD